MPVPVFDPTIPPPSAPMPTDDVLQVDGAVALPPDQPQRQLRRPREPLQKTLPARDSKKGMDKPGAYFPKRSTKPVSPSTGARSRTFVNSTRKVAELKIVESVENVQPRYPTRQVVNSPSEISDLTKTTEMNFNASVVTRPLKNVSQTKKPQFGKSARRTNQ